MAMRPAVTRLLFSFVLGLLLTLLSTFVAERSATATYPEILGCEESCIVAASGWPLVFVRDYTGMSVINTADIVEVLVRRGSVRLGAVLAQRTFLEPGLLCGDAGRPKACGAPYSSPVKRAKNA